jgi:hypothetical protein
MRKVTIQDAAQFGHVWTHQGVAIPMKDVHFQFAADFANIVLKSFVEDAQKQAALQAQLKPRIIMEGVQ